MSKLCRALRLARTLYVYKEKSQVFILTVFISAHVVNDFYVTVLPAFLPALSDEFNLDYGELGILSLTFTLLSGVLQPILGPRADRYGQRRLIVSVGFFGGCRWSCFRRFEPYVSFSSTRSRDFGRTDGKRLRSAVMLNSSRCSGIPDRFYSS